MSSLHPVIFALILNLRKCLRRLILCFYLWCFSRSHVGSPHEP